MQCKASYHAELARTMVTVLLLPLLLLLLLLPLSLLVLYACCSRRYVQRQL
jgi:hypothetical protein